MKRLIALTLALAMVFAGQVTAADKVGVCHATGSATNPYVHIVIDRSGWENGHSKHEGDFLSEDPNCPTAAKPTATPKPTAAPTVAPTAKPTQTPAQATPARTVAPSAPQRTPVAAPTAQAPTVRTLPSTSTK